MKKSKRVPAAIKVHGGKFHLADWIISHFPRRYLTYCEPYFGGGSVLLKLNPNGHSEVVNDLDHELVHFWEAIANPSLFNQFSRIIGSAPFSEEAFNFAKKVSYKDHVNRAVAFFITARQSLAGRRKDFAPISTSRTRRGMNEQVSAWLAAIDGLPEVHERMRRVLILCRDAISCIESVDHKQTLFYCDPPYLHETRASRSEYGHYEMTKGQHKALLEKLASIGGKFILSGYRSKLYDDFAKKQKWRRVQKKVPNSAAGGKEKRIMTECLWMNY